MLKKMPGLTMLLVGAILIGLIAHGFELFMPIEGNNLFGWIKALGFPLALECGNAIGLFVAFSHQTKGRWTRFIASVIGLLCLTSSVLIQFHFYKGRIDYDGFYSLVLPLLVALLSGLAGLLDRDYSLAVAAPQPAPQPDLVERLAQMQNQMERSIAQALAGLPDLVHKEVGSALYNPLADGGETEPSAVLTQAQSLLLVGEELPVTPVTPARKQPLTVTAAETELLTAEPLTVGPETVTPEVLTGEPETVTDRLCAYPGCEATVNGRSRYCSDSHRVMMSRNKVKA